MQSTSSRPTGATTAPRSASPTLISVFLAAIAASALHVLDDATLHREPGTTIADHLTGAGFLLAVLAVAALVLPRLRAGAQASIAAVVGALGVTFGALHGAELRSSGFRPADVSALLALVGGLASLALAAVLLWQSRRGGPRPRRYLRRALLFVGAAVVVNYLVFPVLFAVGVTDQPRKRVLPADLGRPYERVSVRTSDGLRLAGWYVPSRNGASVIAFPGRRGPVAHARMLVRHGYGVLLLDMRGTGESDGDSNAFGWSAGADVEAALDYLSHRRDVKDGAIGGLGLSVGGELMLQTASHDDRLRAVVSEGAGFRTLREGAKLGGAVNALNAPQSAVLFGALRILAPSTPPEPLYDLVAQFSPRPIFLIEAGHGQGGEELSALYYDRAREPKSRWLIPEAHHTGGLESRPAEYERRVVGFFDRTLRRSNDS